MFAQLGPLLRVLARAANHAGAPGAGGPRRQARALMHNCSAQHVYE